jgi:hypothetical protein
VSGWKVTKLDWIFVDLSCVRSYSNEDLSKHLSMTEVVRTTRCIDSAGLIIHSVCSDWNLIMTPISLADWYDFAL